MSLSYSNKQPNRNRRKFVQYSTYQDTATQQQPQLTITTNGGWSLIEEGKA
jgi:hypothetical protein